mgnify:CR=1 FL=1|tara:strand:- start:825 stop:2462 length:1638 start_codon:yes stop_codon:yes gene_type:complete
MEKHIIALEVDESGAVTGIKKLSKSIDELDKDVKGLGKSTDKSIGNIEKDSKGAKKGLSGIATGFKSVGTAIKVAGIGLIVGLFVTLKGLFEENQKVVDFFNTSFSALSIAFNDFFKFMESNIGPITSYFKSLFDDPVQSIKDFGIAIKDNLIERFNSFLDTLGFVASAVKKVFSGDFAGALEDVKLAGKESLDVLTGVNDSFDKTVDTVTNVTKAINDYTTSTFKSAKANTILQKEALKAQALNQGLIEQFDLRAEKQRQIRDDESRSIKERIAANEKLGEVLDKQEIEMRKNAELNLAAAQSALAINKDSLDLQLALIDAQNELMAVEATVTGFRSEQLTNRNALEREALDKTKELAEEEMLIEQEKRESRNKTFDNAVMLAGAETSLGKALLIAKQGLLLKDLIMEARKTITFSAMAASRSAVAVAEGTAQTAKVGFPQNIPLLIGYAAQAAGIIGAITSAVGKTKGIASSFGANTGGSTEISQPQAQSPSFNIVGQGPGSQIASALGEQQQTPIQAFVVSQDVTTAQSLENGIISGATLGG